MDNFSNKFKNEFTMNQCFCFFQGTIIQYAPETLNILSLLLCIGDTILRNIYGIMLKNSEMKCFINKRFISFTLILYLVYKEIF